MHSFGESKAPVRRHQMLLQYHSGQTADGTESVRQLVQQPQDLRQLLDRCEQRGCSSAFRVELERIEASKKSKPEKKNMRDALRQQMERWLEDEARQPAEDDGGSLPAPLRGRVMAPPIDEMTLLELLDRYENAGGDSGFRRSLELIEGSSEADKATMRAQLCMHCFLRDAEPQPQPPPPPTSLPTSSPPPQPPPPPPPPPDPWEHDPETHDPLRNDPALAREPPKLTAGGRAVVDGLTARPELNGSEVVLLKLGHWAKASERGRWAIRCVDGRELSVPVECLTPLQAPPAVPAVLESERGADGLASDDRRGGAVARCVDVARRLGPTAARTAFAQELTRYSSQCERSERCRAG